MVDLFIRCIDMLISIFGVTFCLYILIDNTLNVQKAKQVILTCLAGFFWFAFLYMSVLQTHEITVLELLWKYSVLYIMIVCMNNEIICVRNKEIRHGFKRVQRGFTRSPE